MKKTLLLKTALAVALATPMLASAESQISTAGANSSVSARLNFSVVVPRVLFLAVGTGANAQANNSTIDTVTFDYSTNPSALGSGAATSSSNVIPVRVVGNNGVIALKSTNTGALSNGLGDTIPWSAITATSSDATNFASPTPAGASVNLGLSSGTKVTKRTANWTFSYANSAVVAPGTYGTTNGQVLYTATMP